MNKISPNLTTDQEDLIVQKAQELTELLAKFSIPYFIFTLSPNKKDAGFAAYNNVHEERFEDFITSLSEVIEDMTEGCFDITLTEKGLLRLTQNNE